MRAMRGAPLRTPARIVLWIPVTLAYAFFALQLAGLFGATEPVPQLNFTTAAWLVVTVPAGVIAWRLVRYVIQS